MNDKIQQNYKLALITGASRRIGAEIAKNLHANHYNVIIHCNSSLKIAKELIADLNLKRPNSAFEFQADLENSLEISKLTSFIKEKFNKLDLLVNNASVFIKHDLNNYDELLWQKIFKINVFAPLILSQQLFPLLKKSSGNIVNITDINAVNPIVNYNIYLQSKAALNLQTKALSLELAPFVRVNAIAPGAIIWPENENSLTNEIKQKIMQETPLLRNGSAQNIAEAVLAFANNNFITGQILHVDGGRSIV